MENNPELAAGDLDRRVILQSPVYNEFEDEITAWTDAAETWAAINPQFAREQKESGRTIALTNVEITIRNSKRFAIDSRWRIQEKRAGGVTYQIEGILDPLRRGAQVRMQCREID